MNSGLLRSADGGRFFAYQEDGPWIGLAADDSRMVGIRGRESIPLLPRPFGSLHISLSDGSSFVDTGTQASWTTIVDGRIFIDGIGGLSYSDDNGQTFVRSTGVKGFSPDFGLVRVGDRLLAHAGFGRFDGGEFRGVVVSTDQGASFEPLVQNVSFWGAAALDDRLIALSADSSQQLISVDPVTASVTTLTEPRMPEGSIFSLAFSQGTLFAAHVSDGLWRGTMSDAGMTVSRIAPSVIYDLQTDGRRLYALDAERVRVHVRLGWRAVLVFKCSDVQPVSGPGARLCAGANGVGRQRQRGVCAHRQGTAPQQRRRRIVGATGPSAVQCCVERGDDFERAPALRRGESAGSTGHNRARDRLSVG